MTLIFYTNLWTKKCFSKYKCKLFHILNPFPNFRIVKCFWRTHPELIQFLTAALWVAFTHTARVRGRLLWDWTLEGAERGSGNDPWPPASVPTWVRWWERAEELRGRWGVPAGWVSGSPETATRQAASEEAQPWLGRRACHRGRTRTPGDIQLPSPRSSSFPKITLFYLQEFFAGACWFLLTLRRVSDDASRVCREIVVLHVFRLAPLSAWLSWASPTRQAASEAGGFEL